MMTTTLSLRWKTKIIYIFIYILLWCASVNKIYGRSKNARSVNTVNYNLKLNYLILNLFDNYRSVLDVARGGGDMRISYPPWPFFFIIFYWLYLRFTIVVDLMTFMFTNRLKFIFYLLFHAVFIRLVEVDQRGNQHRRCYTHLNDRKKK